jgi:LmbE family N-acetylglucosaminyl deacetylase
MSSPSGIALAAVAHPDDIEFMMSGTMLALQKKGWKIHFWNLANGYCGTNQHSREKIIAMRAEEARESAQLAGAVWHEPLFDDLAVFYDARSLAMTAAVMREIQPGLVLTHSPSDYMEDHQNVCRLMVTAAFSRGMSNYVTDPPRDSRSGPLRIYHALPHGLRDGLGRAITPDFFVDVAAHMAFKRELLACHRSQQAWLDVSQGMNAYLEEMENLCREMGAMSGSLQSAEAFLRHSHLGFCPAEYDPLPSALVGSVTPRSL